MVKTIFRRALGVIIEDKNQFLGKHIIAEFWGAEVEEDRQRIEEILSRAARESNSTPLKVIFHNFEPKGLSAAILLAESHIALHYWPEYKYLAVDIFTCGKKSMPEKGLEYLRKVFKPERVEVKKINRGKVVLTSGFWKR